MATKPPAKPAVNAVQVLTIHIPIILAPNHAAQPREKIDVIPEFVDFQIAKLDNKALADTLGTVKKAGKDLEKWEKLAVTVVKARMMGMPVPEDGTPKTIYGDKYNAIVTSVPRKSLNKEKLEAKFGVGAVDDCYSETESDTLNCKPV